MTVANDSHSACGPTPHDRNRVSERPDERGLLDSLRFPAPRWQRWIGCSSGCPLDHHEPPCRLAGGRGRRSVDYGGSAVWVMAGGDPVLRSLRQVDHARHLEGAS
jgi:hypothetical protein